MKSKFYDNWGRVDLSIIPVLDPRINLFLTHGVQMFSIDGSVMPYGTFKFLAVKSLVDDAIERGMLEPGDALVEASSGQTGSVLPRVGWQEAKVVDVLLVMRNDLPRAKTQGPIISGATIIPPMLIEDQHNPSGRRQCSTIETARIIGGGGWKPDGWKKGSKGVLNLDQYANPAIKNLYRTYAVSNILNQVPNLTTVFTPMGTGGTTLGLFEGFCDRLDERPKFFGALCEDGQEIPGMRDEKGMVEIGHPWNTTPGVSVVKVARKPSFLCAPWLDWTMGIPAGPSGGAAYVACCMTVQKYIDEGRLEELRNKKTGEIVVGFIIHDHVGFYTADRFTTEWPPEYFHPRTAPLPQQLIFGA